jgi:tetratricopeptide (TPR) repeat protein
VDLKSKLRAIVQPSQPASPKLEERRRELTYEPDLGGYQASPSIDDVAEQLGGRPVETSFGQCLVIDRRYESDRWHGDVRIGECEVESLDSLGMLDPSLRSMTDGDPSAPSRGGRGRTVFIDLETTGLSGGAGTVAFLVGCGFYDLGAFHVRQFLLTSYAAERALLAAATELFDEADLIVTYNGKTFDVPVMETRWSFHRMDTPLDGVPHFDALHPARRLWRTRADEVADGGCRLTTLERILFDVRRVGDVHGFEIPARFFHFMRSGDARPLEPVLEHNRLDLVSLAAVTARAARLMDSGADGCVDEHEAIAVGRIFERAGHVQRAEACYRRGASAESIDVRAESLYRLGLRLRRDRRFAEAADVWREIVALTATRSARRRQSLNELREFALEALAIHQEHRERDLGSAQELAQFALDETEDGRRADGYRHRLARLQRKLDARAPKVKARAARPKESAQLLWS